MQIFHLRCPSWRARLEGLINGIRWFRHRGRFSIGQPFSRVRLEPQTVADDALCARRYRCERCGLRLHIDMDWQEGATVESRARLD